MSVDMTITVSLALQIMGLYNWLEQRKKMAGKERFPPLDFVFF